jgi:hypothetical protein
MGDVGSSGLEEMVRGLKYHIESWSHPIGDRETSKILKQRSNMTASLH